MIHISIRPYMLLLTLVVTTVTAVPWVGLIPTTGTEQTEAYQGTNILQIVGAYLANLEFEDPIQGLERLAVRQNNPGLCAYVNGTASE